MEGSTGESGIVIKIITDRNGQLDSGVKSGIRQSKMTKPKDVLIPVEHQGVAEGQNSLAAVAVMAINALSDLPHEKKLKVNDVLDRFPTILARTKIPRIVEEIQPEEDRSIRFVNHSMVLVEGFQLGQFRRAICSRLDRGQLVQLSVDSNDWRQKMLGLPRKPEWGGACAAVLVHGYLHDGNTLKLRVQDPASGPRVESLEHVVVDTSWVVASEETLRGLFGGTIIGEFSKKR